MKPNFTRKPSRLIRVVYLLLTLLFVSTTAWADNPSWVRSGDSWDAATKKLTVNSSLSSNAYRNYTEIETVVISNGVTSIGGAAFHGCTNLKTVSIGNGVESIGYDAFYGCTHLKTVSIGNGVTSIGDGAFYGCNQLESVFMTRTSSAPTIYNHTFPMNANLKIYVPMDSQGYILNVYQMNSCYFGYQNYLVGRWVSGDCMVGLNNGVLTVIGIGAMVDYKNESSSQWSHSRSDITSIVLNEGVTRIGNLAFPACNNLESVTIPNSVTHIGSEAFRYCRKLGSVNIPSSVTTISKDVFGGCDNLTSITLNGEATIGAYAFPDGASVTIAEGLLLHNGTEVLRGNVTDMSKLNGKTLTVVPWIGTGTANDPFVIENPSQLDLLAQRVNSGTDYSGKYFVLANDIQYDHDTDWDDATSNENNFTAIGGIFNQSYFGFRGTFDGQGHSIRGIRIYKAGTDDADYCQGLFGYINGGVVKNVSVSDMRITGFCEVGGIVGSSDGVKVDNCHATATVCLNAVQEAASNFGGIVGHLVRPDNSSLSTINGCTSAVSITTTGNLSNCQDFGGIVGNSADNTSVKNCLAIGVAIPDISFKNYSQNDVTASGAIAGLYDNANGILSNNFYINCTLNGTPTASGIGIGYDYDSNERHDITDNNAAVPATLHTLTLGEHITAIGALLNQGGIISVPAGSAVTLSYSGSLSDGQIAVFSLNGQQLSGSSFIMPAADATASVSTTTAWGIDADADGSADHPYIITRPAELDLLAQRVNSGTDYSGKHFVQGADIAYNPNGTDDNDENYTAIGGQGNPFKGIFDGLGYTISGIRINTKKDRQGLFGDVGASGTISNVTLVDASIKGLRYVGGIAGYKSGTIQNCLVIGTTLRCNNSNVGIIIGNNSNHNGTLNHNYYSNCERNGNDHGIGTSNNDCEGACQATILNETEAVPTNLQDLVVFRRVFTGGKASTICLPFDYTPAASEGTYYSFAGISKENDTYVATMTAAAETLTANTPYVFVPAGTDSRLPVLYHGDANYDVSGGLSATSGDWTFRGTYERLTYGTDPFDGWVYGFASKAKEVDGVAIQAGQFVHAKTGAGVPPMRCFLKYKDGEKFTGTTRSAVEEDLPQTIVVRFVNSVGETTAIGTMKIDDGQVTIDHWYTLDGVRLNDKPSKKGIYIHNGKKEAIKN